MMLWWCVPLLWWCVPLHHQRCVPLHHDDLMMRATDLMMRVTASWWFDDACHCFDDACHCIMMIWWCVPLHHQVTRVDLTRIIRCIYGVSCRAFAKYTVIYGVFIRCFLQGFRQVHGHIWRIYTVFLAEISSSTRSYMAYLYGVSCRDFAKYTVIYGVFIRCFLQGFCLVHGHMWRIYTVFLAKILSSTRSYTAYIYTVRLRSLRKLNNNLARKRKFLLFLGVLSELTSK